MHRLCIFRLNKKSHPEVGGKKVVYNNMIEAAMEREVTKQAPFQSVVNAKQLSAYL